MKYEQLNPHSCKTYLLTDSEQKHALLIDPILEHVNTYIDMLEKRKLELGMVIDTHTHADHISGGAALKDRTECDYLMHTGAPAKCAGIRVNDGDKYDFNGLKIQVMHTPGHTADSISLVIDDLIFTGDFLFLDDAGGGRDDLPGGDPGAHWESLKKLAGMDGSLLVLPAHEYRNRQPSTLDTQRKTNPHLAERTKDDFVKYLEDLRLGPADWMKDVLKANYSCARDPKAAWIPADSPACEIRGTMDKNVNEIQPEYISVSEFRKILDSGGKKPILLDVREPFELHDMLGKIDGVINIPIASLSSKLGQLEQYANDHIVVICRSGSRATTGAQILKKSGFMNVSVLTGGMVAYKFS